MHSFKVQTPVDNSSQLSLPTHPNMEMARIITVSSFNQEGLPLVIWSLCQCLWALECHSMPNQFLKISCLLLGWQAVLGVEFTNNLKLDRLQCQLYVPLIYCLWYLIKESFSAPLALRRINSIWGCASTSRSVFWDGRSGVYWSKIRIIKHDCQ